MPAYAGMTRMTLCFRHSRESGNPAVSAIKGFRTDSETPSFWLVVIERSIAWEMLWQCSSQLLNRFCLLFVY
jgi:hypothetical protein